jgi:hypothetical protein
VVAALGALDVPLPKAPADPAAILDELDRRISPVTMAMAGPLETFVVSPARPR